MKRIFLITLGFLSIIESSLANLSQAEREKIQSVIIDQGIFIQLKDYDDDSVKKLKRIVKMELNLSNLKKVGSWSDEEDLELKQLMDETLSQIKSGKHTPVSSPVPSQRVSTSSDEQDALDLLSLFPEVPRHDPLGSVSACSMPMNSFDSLHSLERNIELISSRVGFDDRSLRCEGVLRDLHRQAELTQKIRGPLSCE